MKGLLPRIYHYGYTSDLLISWGSPVGEFSLDAKKITIKENRREKSIVVSLISITYNNHCGLK